MKPIKPYPGIHRKKPMQRIPSAWEQVRSADPHNAQLNALRDLASAQNSFGIASPWGIQNVNGPLCSPWLDAPADRPAPEGSSPQGVSVSTTPAGWGARLVASFSALLERLSRTRASTSRDPGTETRGA